MARLGGVACLLVFVAATACAATAPGGRPAVATGTNVSGVLDRGPAPTCPADEPCDPMPRPGSVVVFTATGGAETRVDVAGDGTFALHLDPGDYTITLAPPPFQGRVVPSSVTVPPTGSIFLTLHIARPS